MLLKIFYLFFAVSFVQCQSVFDISKVEPKNDLCDAQLEYIEENLNQGALWAKIMRDAWGNFPSGTFSGNYYDFGAFDQCIRFTHNSNSLGTFHGQHCTVTFPYNLEAVDIRGKFAPAPYDPSITIGVGICVPDSCSHSRIAEISNVTLVSTRNTKLASFPPLSLMCSTQDESFEWNTLRIFAV
jgi:hypothetical protein